jgi:hypothetical protein
MFLFTLKVYCSFQLRVLKVKDEDDKVTLVVIILLFTTSLVLRLTKLLQI